MEINEKHICKFWSRVNKDGPIHPILGTACWIWTGWFTPDGYGRIYVGRRGRNAHRFAWQILQGEIPEDLCILHRCDNPPCCNPEHLFIGTREDNNKDRNAKGRGPDVRGLANPNSKLTEDDVREIRRRVENGEPVKLLTKEFGISDVMIYNVVLKRNWSHVA